MRRIFDALFLALCLLSLANCRRGGGMMGGGGPMEGSGPCPRCNQLREADNDFRRERIDPFDQNAPFPNDNGNINQGIDGNLVGSGNNIVQDENISGGNLGLQKPFEALPGLGGPVINPADTNPVSGKAVEAPGVDEEETSMGAEPHRSTASDETKSPKAHAY